MFQHESTIWSDQFDPSRFELSLDLFAKEGRYKGFSAVCISLFLLVLSMVTESHQFSIPRHLSGLWESSVLSTSSLLLFAAHWKRLLQFLDAELRVFEPLPLERNRLDIGTWGRWCFWGCGCLDRDLATWEVESGVSVGHMVVCVPDTTGLTSNCNPKGGR